MEQNCIFDFVLTENIEMLEQTLKKHLDFQKKIHPFFGFCISDINVKFNFTCSGFCHKPSKITRKNLQNPHKVSKYKI